MPPFYLVLYGDRPDVGAHFLRAVRRLEWRVVVPGYFLMLATSLWMARLAWPLTTPWLRDALVL